MTDPTVLYQSPPGSNSNDGAIPTVYVQNWNRFTNLTQAQIAAFQAFAEDLLKYSSLRRWRAEISGVTVGGIPINTQLEDQQKIAALKQAFDTGTITQVSYFDATGNPHTVDAAAATAIYQATVLLVQALYDARAQIATNINNKTFTTRAQVDAVYAGIAPNSPSAKGIG